MKAIINQNNKDITYPCLAKCIQGADTFIVLFLGEREGIVVQSYNCMRAIGECDIWTPVKDNTTWTILSPSESVTLSNE